MYLHFAALIHAIEKLCQIPSDADLEHTFGLPQSEQDKGLIRDQSIVDQTPVEARVARMSMRAHT